jgi:UDP-N-acetylglucosamine 2-epimerase
VHQVGDVTLDVFQQASRIAQERSKIAQNLGLIPGAYLLATIHRQVNTDHKDRLEAIVSAFAELEMPIVFPIHPRTRKAVNEYGLEERLAQLTNIHVIDPVGYFDMLELERNAKVIITDSGGVIREAYFAGVPSIIVDNTTEWINLVREGWSTLVETKPEAIKQAVAQAIPPSTHGSLFGDGGASEYVVDYLK